MADGNGANTLFVGSLQLLAASDLCSSDDDITSSISHSKNFDALGLMLLTLGGTGFPLMYFIQHVSYSPFYTVSTFLVNSV